MLTEMGSERANNLAGLAAEISFSAAGRGAMRKSRTKNRHSLLVILPGMNLWLEIDMKILLLLLPQIIELLREQAGNFC